MKYFIYKITSPSGKIYIGQTKNIESRYRSYKAANCKSQKIIYNSIIKYGFKSHLFTILHKGLSKEKADELEIFYINFFKNKKVSLNIKDGGNITYNFKTKAIYKLDFNFNIIEEYSSLLEAGLKNNIKSSLISTCIFRKSYYTSGFYWCLKSKYCKNFSFKKSKIILNKGNICKFNLEGNLLKTYISYNEIKKDGFNIDAIQMCLNKNKQYSSGFLWCYEKNKDIIEFDLKKLKSSYGKKIIQYDLNNNLINTFNSLNQIISLHNYKKSNILNNLNNRSKTAYKYIWKYEK